MPPKSNLISLLVMLLVNLVIGVVLGRAEVSPNVLVAHGLWAGAWLVLLIAYAIGGKWGPRAETFAGDVGSVLMIGFFLSYTNNLKVFYVAGPALVVVLVAYGIAAVYFIPASKITSETLGKSSTAADMAEQVFHGCLAYMPSLTTAILGVVLAGGAFFPRFGWSAFGVAASGLVYGILQVPLFALLCTTPWEPSPRWWRYAVVFRSAFAVFYWVAILSVAGIGFLTPEKVNPWVQVVIGILTILAYVGVLKKR